MASSSLCRWVCLHRQTAWGRTETASRFASCLRTALWLDPSPSTRMLTTTFMSSNFSLLYWLIMCVQHFSD